MTMGDVAENVAYRMLRRTDIFDDCLEAARKVYLSMCGKVPFEELQVRSDELTITSGTDTYSLANLDPKLAGIMSIRLTNSNGVRRLKRSHTRKFDQLQTANNGGIPYAYARQGQNMELYPVPSNSTMTYRIRYWARPTMDSVAPENVELLYPDEWQELHELETYYRILIAPLRRSDEASLLMMPSGLPKQAEPKRRITKEFGIIPRLWNDLLQTVYARESVDEEYSISPIVRAYQ